MLVLVACHSNKSENDSGNGEQNQSSTHTNGEQAQSPENNNQLPEIITEELVRNHPETPASDFVIIEYENDVVIKEYLGNDPIVVIPETINGKPVLEIKGYLFANDSTVKGVLIPKTVTRTPATFANNDDVQVVICEGVEELGRLTFMGCSALHTLMLGDNLKKLGDFSISGCHSLTEVYIPESVTEIYIEFDSARVFYDCPKLTIKGKAGSYVEEYANRFGLKFQAV